MDQTNTFYTFNLHNLHIFLMCMKSHIFIFINIKGSYSS